MQRTAKTLALVLTAGSLVQLSAQAPPPPAQGPPPAQQGQQVQPGPGAPGAGGIRRSDDMPPPPPGRNRPERMLQPRPGGRWWNNPEMAQRLSLNSDQQKKMDDIFQANRLRLIDLNATLRKDEIILEPLLSSDTPDEAKILAQIDKVAQARAELEKANARFLLGIRRALTPEQWKKLQAERPNPEAPGGPGGRRDPGSPGGPPPLPRR
ncbi:MAG TPA: periplasmic heavy metal sensor [Bryobacteraceae bacterium]|nr:periplasmic heavy metal sensor [Bryobacteraceae bacterium]